jgi:deoxyribodipyrimidine photo-lyase
MTPIILWFRRDLRLTDHPALHEAARSGRPVIPVFLLDEGVEGLGAAPRMRLGMGVAALARGLEGIGSRLVLRRGRAAEALAALRAETGGEVWFTRLHDPDSRARDEGLGRAFPGHLLLEPEEVRTKDGGHFKVNAPFLKALLARDVGEPLPAPARLTAPETWPAGDRLEEWRLDAPMNRGAGVVAPWQRPGEEGARERLQRFVRERLAAYSDARNYPARDGSSRLSENLTYGEISARECWREGLAGTARGPRRSCASSRGATSRTTSCGTSRTSPPTTGSPPGPPSPGRGRRQGRSRRGSAA